MNKPKQHAADRFHLVEIEWEDAEHEGAWSALEDEIAHQLGVVRSVGWLIHENDKRYVVSASISDLEVGNKQYIPKGMVVKIDVLRHRRADKVGKRRKVKPTPVPTEKEPQK